MLIVTKGDYERTNKVSLALQNILQMSFLPGYRELIPNFLSFGNHTP